MTVAQQIAVALRELAPDKKFTDAEVRHIDAIAALWAARTPAQPQSGGGWLGGAGTAETRPAGLKNADAFFAPLRPLIEAQVSGFNVILSATGAARWRLSWVAYALATTWHETARTMQPIKELGGDGYLRRMYDIEGARPGKARELGNVNPGDGIRFAGRGYVQLTGRTNYANAGAALGVDLIAEPSLAMRPDIAARILVWGMEGGKFTGKGLGDYLPNSLANPTQYGAARRIINGQDCAAEIAAHAMRFQAALQAGGWA